MPQAKSIHSFPDCRSFMDRALAAPNGYFATFSTKGAAFTFSQRCYSARTLEARKNGKLYPQDNPLHNTSVWHRLVLTIHAISPDPNSNTDSETFRVIAAHGENALDSTALDHGELPAPQAAAQEAILPELEATVHPPRK